VDSHLKHHWEDWVNFAAGAWLAVMPWIFGFGDNHAAVINAIIVALILLAFSTLALVWVEAWEEWVGIALGVWLIVAPWALGFGDRRLASGLHAITGALVAGVAIFEMWEDHVAQRRRSARESR
jgi:hypothetical protein